jgi:hypothetical protein
MIKAYQAMKRPYQDYDSAVPDSKAVRCVIGIRTYKSMIQMHLDILQLY